MSKIKKDNFIKDNFMNMINEKDLEINEYGITIFNIDINEKENFKIVFLDLDELIGSIAAELDKALIDFMINNFVSYSTSFGSEEIKIDDSLNNILESRIISLNNKYNNSYLLKNYLEGEP